MSLVSMVSSSVTLAGKRSRRRILFVRSFVRLFVFLLPLCVYFLSIRRRLKIVFIKVSEVSEILTCNMRLSRTVSFLRNGKFISQW